MMMMELVRAKIQITKTPQEIQRRHPPPSTKEAHIFS